MICPRENFGGALAWKASARRRSFQRLTSRIDSLRSDTYRSSRAGIVFRAINLLMASAGMRTARPQFTRGSLRRISHALTVAGFRPKASAVSDTESSGFVLVCILRTSGVILCDECDSCRGTRRAIGERRMYRFCGRGLTEPTFALAFSALFCAEFLPIRENEDRPSGL